MPRDPRFHRRCHAQAFVNAAKVVVSLPKHHGCLVVLKFLSKGITEAREAPRAHPQAQIAAFDDRGANAV